MVGSTHDEAGSGRPRLIFSLGGEVLEVPGDGALHQAEFELLDPVTVIGSDERADLRLTGIEPLHAEIVHDHSDEYVFVQGADTHPTRVNGVPMGRAVLRTGDRIETGTHTMSYYREERADHGRPFGGRQGGEGAHQEAQPPRSAVTGAAEPDAATLTTQPAPASPAQE